MILIRKLRTKKFITVSKGRFTNYVRDDYKYTYYDDQCSGLYNIIDLLKIKNFEYLLSEYLLTFYCKEKSKKCKKCT